MNKEIGIGIVTLVLMLSFVSTNIGAGIISYVTELEEGDIQSLYIDDFYIWELCTNYPHHTERVPSDAFTHSGHRYVVEGIVTADRISGDTMYYKTPLVGCLVHIKVYRDGVLIDETEAVTSCPLCGTFEKAFIAGEPGNYVVRVSVDLYGAHAREEARFKVVPETTPTPVTPAPIPTTTPSVTTLPTSTSIPTTSIPAFQIIPAIVILLAVAYLLKRGI